MLAVLLRLAMPFLPLCFAAEATDLQGVLVCREVAWEASRQGVAPSLAVSLAWHESRFQHGVVSRAGAVGPLQVLPRYWCREKDCDLVEAGVTALRTFLSHADGNLVEGVCRFNCGLVCKPKGRRYAQKVVARARRLRRLGVSL